MNGLLADIVTDDFIIIIIISSSSRCSALQ